MLLSGSFQIYIKVLSREHMEHKSKKLKVGINKSKQEERRKRYLLRVPSGYIGKETVFEGQCSVISVLFGKIYNNHQLKKESSYLNLNAVQRYIKSKNDNLIFRSKATGISLNNKVKEILNEMNVTYNEQGYNPNDINAKLAQNLGIQIHVFSTNSTNFKIASFPSEYNPNKEQIYLLQTKPTNAYLVHYEPITNLKAYFSDVGRRYCFDCKLIYTTRESAFRHTCMARSFCKSCRRKTFDSNFWHLPSQKTDYCNQLDNQAYGSCTDCNLHFKSSDCQKNHRNTECRRGKKLLCNK